MIYETLTNNELLTELTELLNPEEISDIEAMQINIEPSVKALNRLKRLLLATHLDKSVEHKEQSLTQALVRTKMDTGSSLSLDSNGKLNVIHYFDSNIKPDKKLLENFKFMASLTNTSDVDLEIMIIKSAFKEILSCPGSILKDLSADLIVEIKRRILGIKPVEEDDVAMLKI